jgi:HEAT repeat protein
MKHKLIAAVALVLTIALTATAFAGDAKDKKDIRPTLNRSLVEANLLTGIESENFGLRTSSAMMLGDIKCSQAVFPLMHMLRNETDERARIVAALSLYKIGDPVGIYAVKQSAQFDESARVRKLCTLFYNEYKKNNGQGS